jgi:heterodisulfide reductase subunit B
MTIVARQFALMTEAGYEHLVPSCITSFGLYTEIIDTWHHFPEVENRVRENLKKATGREFRIPKNLAHASDVIYKFRKEISAKASFRLINKQTGNPLKVVEHIGCHYSKMFPGKGIGVRISLCAGGWLKNGEVKLRHPNVAIVADSVSQYL